MKQLSRKFIIIICIIVILFILALLLKPQPEIVKVGPIPKAFNNPTTDLPIKEPRSKEKRENTIPSVVSNKTIYLTFDDGPSYLTNNILDILSQENIPATFFVVGRHLEKYQASLRRAYQDGHTIALHTNTHNYQYIYTSDENYFNDLKAISDKVFNIIGQHSRIVRLLGGVQIP